MSYLRLPRRQASGDRRGLMLQMVEKVCLRQLERAAHAKNLVMFALGVLADQAGQLHWLTEKVDGEKEKANG